MSTKEKAKQQRYSCFTEEQQAQFDSLSKNEKKYVIFRSQGYDKRNSYRMAGYREGKNMSQNAYHIENIRKPWTQDLIRVLSGHKARVDVYKENTPVSKKIDEKAEELPPEMEMTLVNADAPVEQKLPEVEDMSGEEARRIQFYRQVANGTIKSIQITRTYDKDGNLTGKKVVETSDIDMRIKARKEVDRILGLNEMANLGSIEAGDINIMIVDARKRAELPQEKIIEATASES